MKLRLLSAVAGAALLTVSWAVLASACDEKAKAAQASVAAKSQACTAEMAAKCTAAQAAACKAKGASAVTAVSGGAYHCGAKASAATAAASEAYHCGSTAGAAKAAHAGCPFASGTSTAGAPATMSDVRYASSPGAKGACKPDAYSTGGASCTGRGIAAIADGYAHLGCDACAEMATCEQELKAAGTMTQVVKLKNGIMYVYTADSPSRVRAVQAVMARRTDRLIVMTAAGDKTRLCPECKSMRGAIASGKLTREMVSIEGGCLTLMTSEDPAIVAKLHAMAGIQNLARAKS